MMYLRVSHLDRSNEKTYGTENAFEILILECEETVQFQIIEGSGHRISEA